MDGAVKRIQFENWDVLLKRQRHFQSRERHRRCSSDSQPGRLGKREAVARTGRRVRVAKAANCRVRCLDESLKEPKIARRVLLQRSGWLFNWQKDLFFHGRLVNCFTFCVAYPNAEAFSAKFGPDLV